ncbi:pentatricopeptide repeat-containing protein At1g07590, mitochondrial isoform X2 [Typha latifolia]|uniref:pentatricopeptide repeat-containing protein At1g07590, mitochondrial isoform X2 n=1 Tax=Typha latifolia TaxID=4733 RepID=UPI003C2D7443
MRSLVLSLLSRGRSAALSSRRIPRTFFLTSCSSLLPDEPPLRPRDQEVDDKFHSSDSLSIRVERLPRGESAVSAFQSWMRDGFPVHRGDIFHAINRLRKRKLNRRALEIMEWVMRERPYKLTELDYSYLLEFTAKLHGISHGESLFLRIPHEYQNELLYNNLVMACLDKGLIKLSYGYMRKMRELGFPISPYVYNRMIILHSSPGRKKTIPRILSQMKADGISPHTSTYNILLKIQANEHNIDGLSKVFNDMKRANVEPNEITYGILAIAHAVARLYTVSETYIEAIEQSKTGNNWSTLDILLILYGYLGKEKELERTWKFVQELPHVRSKSLVLAIEAFGRHGLVEKASNVYKEIKANGCKANAITYRHLTLGCLKAGLVEEALRTMNMAKYETLTLQVRRSKPWLETTHMLLEAFANMGDLENSKKLFEELKESKYCRYAFVYNTLLKSYMKAKVYEPDLLSKMILGGARPDAETYSLLRLIEQFRS